eukprot:4597056-Prymnesium_polylepis.1
MHYGHCALSLTPEIGPGVREHCFACVPWVGPVLRLGVGDTLGAPTLFFTETSRHAHKLLNDVPDFDHDLGPNPTHQLLKTRRPVSPAKAPGHVDRAFDHERFLVLGQPYELADWL